MELDKESAKGLRAIYQYILKNGTVHKNVLKKEIILKAKISEAKFKNLLASLVKYQKISIKGEMVAVNPSILKVGILQKKKDEFFISLKNSNKIYKISNSNASGYMVGDFLDVVIEQNGKDASAVIVRKNTNSATIKEKIKSNIPPKNYVKNPNLLLGRVVKLSHDELVFIPNNKDFPIRRIPILNNKEETVNFQDKICVMCLQNKDVPLWGGTIVEIKGEAGNPICEYDAIAESYGAIMNWDDAGIQKEIEKIPSVVDTTELDLISEEQAQVSKAGKIVDLRHLPFVTVDPASCKDMDDAIYSTINKDGDIVCYVAVANVTKYVNLDSKIGQRYLNGAFTIYAPNKAYNILPTKLSTGICSLNPNEDRLAFVVKSIVDRNTGKTKSSTIYDAIIRSRGKYSYEEAQQAVDNFYAQNVQQLFNKKLLQTNRISLEEQLVFNYFSANILMKGFFDRKMIKFTNNNEREIFFDEDLKDVVDIKVAQHLKYHEVIEAFMINANEATAKHAKDRKLNNIYRVHEKPSSAKEDKAEEFFNLLGIDFDGDLSIEGILHLIEITKGTEFEDATNKFLIKMQSRAVYSDRLFKDDNLENKNEDGISHYALQSKHYSHTTSPIRRVPDYITIFNILADMHKTKPLDKDIINKVIEVANIRQIDVENAEKDFEDFSSILYCENHLGETMNGKISRFRYSSPEENYDDEIIVIVKNEDKGIKVEIPLSQILGRPTKDCVLTEQGCAVLDCNGTIILTLCMPIQFEILYADRKTMTIVGKSSKTLLKRVEQQTLACRYYKKNKKFKKSVLER